MNADSNLPSRSRRDFISKLALAAAALPLTRGVSAAAEGSGRTLHVFSKPLQWLSYEDAAALIAECGFGGIDYTVRPEGHVLPERVEEDLPRAVEAARGADLKVEMITTRITGAQEEHTEKLLRTAAKLGVKYYRFGAWKYDSKAGVWQTLEQLRPVFQELAALNESLGLHGAIQNHAGAGVGSAVWDIHELLRDLDPRWIGMQYDIRHAVAEGSRSWPVGLKLLKPWVRCLDIKDFRWQQSPGKAVAENVPLGEGIVPFDEYFKLVRDLELSGPISVHFEYPPFERATEPLEGAEKRAQLAALMKKDRESLKQWMTKHRVA